MCVCVCVCVSHSVVSLFATSWTIAHQDLYHGNSPGKNTGVGCHSCLQGIFPTQGLNLGLLHCRQILYQLSHRGLLLRVCVSKRKAFVAQMVKNLPAVQETQVQPLGWEDPLEEGMVTHSSILAWRIPWTVR